jgi:hypothetical protein
MGKFAARTVVSADKSRAEIERILSRYGASSFGYGTTPNRAVIMFEAHKRRIKFELPLPNRNAPEFTRDHNGWTRAESTASKMYDQAIRQLWRALALTIKAKLEAVESNITTFESEFLAYIMLPNGRTVGEHTLPKIAEAYESGSVPSLLEHF